MEVVTKNNKSSNKRKNIINNPCNTCDMNIKKKDFKNILKLNIINDDPKENHYLNIKYTKKNIDSPPGSCNNIHNKKRLFNSNLLSDDLPKIIIEKDIISIISPNEKISNTNIEKRKKENLNESKNMINTKKYDKLIFNNNKVLNDIKNHKNYIRVKKKNNSKKKYLTL
jgi:hypothetical protein